MITIREAHLNIHCHAYPENVRTWACWIFTCMHLSYIYSFFMCAQFMSFEPRTCSKTTWNILLICDELEMSKALVEHHGQIFTIHLNTNFRNPFWTDHSLAVSFVHPHHLTLVLFCLQDDDSDFLCSYASGFDLYGSIPKGKCGGAFYFVVFVKKKNQKQKEGIKFLKKKK